MDFFEKRVERVKEYRHGEIGKDQGDGNCRGNLLLFHELEAGREADRDGDQEPLGNRKLTALGFGYSLPGR